MHLNRNSLPPIQAIPVERVKEVVEELEKQLKEVEETIIYFHPNDKSNTVFAMDIQKRQCILNHQELIKEKLLSDGK